MGPMLFLVVLLSISTSFARGPPNLLPGALKLNYVEVHENEPLELICPVTKTPDLSIQWLKNHEELDPMWSSSNLIIRRLTLKISKTDLADAGLYTCNVVNGFGHATASFQVHIISNGTSVNQTQSNDNIDLLIEENDPYADGSGQAPVFLSRSDSVQTGPTRIIQPEGTTVQLKCLASGKPTPEVRWKKNGKVLSEDEYGITQGPILNIKDLRRTDSGNFTCDVFNPFGQLNATFILLVTEKLQFFGDDPRNTTVESGQTVILNCRVRTDDSNVRIQWLKKLDKKHGFQPDAVIFDSEQFEAVRTINEQQIQYYNNVLSRPLILTRAMINEAGQYLCLIQKDNMMNYRKVFLDIIENNSGFLSSTNNKYMLIYVISIPLILLSVCLLIICCLRRHHKKRLQRHAPTNGTTRGSDVLKSSMRTRQPLIHQNAAMIPSTSSGVSNDYLTNSVDSIPVTRQYTQQRYGPSTSSDIASLTSSNLYYARVQAL